MKTSLIISLMFTTQFAFSLPTVECTHKIVNETTVGDSIEIVESKLTHEATPNFIDYIEVAILSEDKHAMTRMKLDPNIDLQKYAKTRYEKLTSNSQNVELYFQSVRRTDSKDSREISIDYKQGEVMNGTSELVYEDELVLNRESKANSTPLDFNAHIACLSKN